MFTQYTPNFKTNARKIVSALRGRKAQLSDNPDVGGDGVVDGTEAVTTDALPTPIQDNQAPSAGNVRYRKKIEQQIRQMREAINTKEWDTALVHSQAITSILELLEKNPGRAAQRNQDFNSRPCDCGSGKESYWETDGRGIPLCRCCSDCRKDKLKKYRPEVVSDSNYEADEPIEPEDDRY